ncbi:4Fe-4S double cluster binding domain-containing protein [Methanospirillum stamsii]|uniref:Epoxyqueuosine reductase n=1 Tax=Methanospirillum stamsii TaxID=1277351 RepID=A0A2V2NCN5_9EURY|nr:4Fe-4S double cluster binding domain-containing protein [Methanospirillum stamsii]PWR76355.1 epoxyqueuosine reductase [Methanospirillum stamsii]
MEELHDQILSLCRDHDATYSGIADLVPLRDEVIRQGGEILRAYSKAVVFGIVLQNSLVDMLPLKNPGLKNLYSHHGYQVINNRIDLLSSRIADIIQNNGYTAFPLPASQRYDKENISSIFSHKLAARQAGFGWIGKSCMLITPEHGPRVRWGSVLTDAPLPAISAPMKEKCGKCRACVDICPVGAYTGEPFREREPREVRFNAQLCDKYFDDLKIRNEKPVCGLCMYICPYGRKKRGKSISSKNLEIQR